MRYSTLETLSLVVFLLFISACGPYMSQTVVLNRENYISQINSAKYGQYKDKIILLNSIIDNSKNTTNFNYYNTEKTIDYDLFYSNPKSSFQQPVVSYMWYVFQKGFETAGLKIITEGSLFDVALTLTFNSITDEEVKFDLLMLGKNINIIQKSFVVTIPKTSSKDPIALEKRAYTMSDKIIETILCDSDFQKALSAKLVI